MIERAGQRAFLALIAGQAAHSIEEYVFRLYDVFSEDKVLDGESLPMVKMPNRR